MHYHQHEDLCWVRARSALYFTILVLFEGIALVYTVKASNSGILNNNVLVVLDHIYNLLSHFFLAEVKFS